MITKEQLVGYWRNKNIVVDENIVKAFLEIPRELFVLPQHKEIAYLDQPLPTIRKQSISQPTTIMIMLLALELKENHKVFEVGAGVAYQAALIAKIIGEKGKLITTEVIPELVQTARENIASLGINNIKIIEADGGNGYQEEALFDRIIITAACPMVPQPLIDQLKEGGIIVAPVGDLESQTMIKGIKRGERLDIEFIGPFQFVPLRGKHGFEED